MPEPKSQPIPARTDPPYDGGERAVLLGFLDYHRDTFRWKCQGLTPEQLLRRAASPSTLCLLGLMRHLADCERQWFSERFGGAEQLFLYGPGDGDLDVYEADDKSVSAAWATWEEQVGQARKLLAHADLDATARRPTRDGSLPSLRWIVLHMLEEYARHNGHADLIREAIDGHTGE
ncbi:MAG: hypothetical protein JWN95_2570 [Frankiales bacterium]|nr:hypothetical protein [Frankiales bacterium]